MTVLWSPSEQQKNATQMCRFQNKLETLHQLDFVDYQQFWHWSVAHPDAFWSAVWDDCGVIGEKGSRVLKNGDRMPGAQWFPDARLNFAENLLQHQSSADALVFWGEDKVQRRLSWDQLRQQVARCQARLKDAGIKPGDRVAALLPNMPETVVAMLAATSLGALWCSASPDFGVQGVLDRFGQLEPKILFTVDYYFYGGKQIDCTEKNHEIAQQLPCLQRTIVVDYAAQTQGSWQAFLGADPATQPEYLQLPFAHPLYVMFSSGTTGKPKCIVHSAGGTLIQHLKEHQLHADIRPNDRLFYFTTCGWMMWNWLVSGLASGATLLLYDGNPMIDGSGEHSILFDFAEQEKMTQFGTSAKFIESCEKANLAPINTHELATIRSVFSTGSPLSPDGFRYVYTHIKNDVLLSSISGGTDILSCFALGNPCLPVRIGELQCRGLGMAVDVFDDAGNSLVAEKGELVCKQPFPSMPIGFWNDLDGQRYHQAYFSEFENIWCHGDYVELSRHGGMIFHGRSDATLNPGGVRIGTAEIYRQVDAMDEVLESIVIGQQWQNDVRVVLFVRLKEQVQLDANLEAKIKSEIRQNTTPRHVPAKVLAVADIPRTKSGKIVELAVRNVVHQQEVKNLESLANPEALAYFANRKELES